jgi:hypothetical protein
MSATLANRREVDNSYSVSYDMYLLLKYASHINVVVCTSVNLIKYVYKYNFKGGHRVISTLGVPDQDGHLLLHGMKLQSLKTSNHVELHKLAGY